MEVVVNKGALLILLFICWGKLGYSEDCLLKAVEVGWFLSGESITVIYEIENNTSKYHFLYGRIECVPDSIDIGSGSIPASWIGTTISGVVHVKVDDKIVLNKSYRRIYLSDVENNWYTVSKEKTRYGFSGTFVCLDMNVKYFKELTKNISSEKSEVKIELSNCLVEVYKLTKSGIKMKKSGKYICLPKTSIAQGNDGRLVRTGD